MADTTKAKIAAKLKGNTHGFVPGQKPSTTKLTRSQVEVVIRRFASGEMTHVIATDLEVDPETVRRIARRKIWRDVDVDAETQAALDSYIGRRACGSKNTKAKLTEVQVVVIKKRLDAGELCKDIAHDHGVTSGTISHIKQGISWGWIS